MTKPVTIPNTFASQSGNVPASELDANYNVLAAALNDIPTYGNYYLDTGAANALVVTTTPPITFTYTAGAWLDVVVTNSSVGACTLNVNAMGAVPIGDSAGNALISLSGGQSLLAGCVYRLVHDGTLFRIASIPQINGSFVGTASSGISGTPTATFVYNIVGNLCSLQCSAGLSGTAAGTTFVVSGVPAICCGQSGANILTRAIDNSVDVLALVKINSAVLTFYNGLAAGTWTASGNRGIEPKWQISYPLT